MALHGESSIHDGCDLHAKRYSAIRSDAFPKNRTCANLPTIIPDGQLLAAKAFERLAPRAFHVVSNDLANFGTQKRQLGGRRGRRGPTHRIAVAIHPSL
jgi:hypothetical protein